MIPASLLCCVLSLTSEWYLNAGNVHHGYQSCHGVLPGPSILTRLFDKLRRNFLIIPVLQMRKSRLRRLNHLHPVNDGVGI